MVQTKVQLIAGHNGPNYNLCRVSSCCLLLLLKELNKASDH